MRVPKPSPLAEPEIPSGFPVDAVRRPEIDFASAGPNADPAVLVALRMISHAGVPMALMIGSDGALVPNRQMADLLAEIAGDAMAGCPVLKALPRSSPFLREVLDKVRTGQSCSFPQQPIRLNRDGQPTTAWFDLEFVPIEDAAGNVLAVLGMASEVTQYIECARRLSESEQRLRLALEGSGMVGIWNLDVETNISVCDANVARTFGLPVRDCELGIDDRHFINAIHPDDRAKVADALNLAIENRAPYRCRYRLQSNTGGTRWVITSGSPAYDNDGKLVRLLGVVIDVTDQMQTASALAESRFQFQTLTEALPQIVWSCDADGRHDYFSTRWSEFTGIPPEEINEETWKHLVHPQDWPLVWRAWQEAMDSGHPYDIDYRFRHHSGEYRWLRVMALPLRNDKGEITRWFGTSTDVQNTYLVAEERDRLARELEQIAAEDHLTQVLTRRAFMTRAAAAIDKTVQSGTRVSLLMLDIDHFKSINDTYGHPAGDKVLAVTAQRISACTKSDDLVGRLGGEEFAVLLPDCTPAQARTVAERIRQSIQSNPVYIEEGATIAVTLSAGITTSSPSDATLERLLLTADDALYKAKASGRNRSIFVAGPDGFS